MAEEGLSKAARIASPAPALTFAKAVSTTAASTNLSAYAGRWVTVKADGGKVYVLTASTQGVAEALDSTAVAGATQCVHIADGDSLSYEIDATNTWLAYRMASGTATVRFWISSSRNP